MTKEDAIKMAKAKLECIERQTSGKAELCNNDCESCSLCYEQGNMGEQKEWLKMAIKSLEQEPCEDAISREEAIDACNQSVNILEATDRIKDLPSVYPKAKEQKWFPISEGLPEENGEYLITWTTSLSKRPFIGISEGEVTSEYDHEFEWLLEDYVKNYPDVKVIAWMPLPESYKESEG